jgi:hypothetical protein
MFCCCLAYPSLSQDCNTEGKCDVCFRCVENNDGIGGLCPSKPCPLNSQMTDKQMCLHADCGGIVAGALLTGAPITTPPRLDIPFCSNTWRYLFLVDASSTTPQSMEELHTWLSRYYFCDGCTIPADPVSPLATCLSTSASECSMVLRDSCPTVGPLIRESPPSSCFHVRTCFFCVSFVRCCLGCVVGCRTRTKALQDVRALMRNRGNHPMPWSWSIGLCSAALEQR